MSLDVVGPYRYPVPHARWLALVTEEVIDPDRPIIDAHHHLWTEPENRYLVEEMAADLGSGHRIEATVFVQAHFGYRTSGPDDLRPVGETERVAALTAATRPGPDRTAIAAAIVGFADLTLGNAVERVLDAHEAAGEGRFRGVRHAVSRDSHFPDGIVLRPAPARRLADRGYRAGLKVLERRGLSYDAMLYHEQLPELVETARAVPGLPIVVDHLGCLLGVGPYAAGPAEAFAVWRRDMARLAACPNVFVKLGGLGMIILGARWHERPRPPGSEELAAAWRPRIETALDLFGPERCMFESNFPVDKGMFSYPVLWNAFKRLAAGGSDAEKDALFGETARRFYRIPDLDRRG